MPPKAKQEAPKVRKPITEDSWQPALNSVPINDDHWWCMITMMTETLPEHTQIVSIFDEVAENGERNAVYSLSYEKLISEVKVLSREDPDKCSTMQGICHYSNNLLEQKSGSLPSPLVARLIKYMVYRSKEKMISKMRREMELEHNIERELHVMQTAVDVGVNFFTNKTNTLLRKRGEEWRDKIFVDDAPEGGPNLYVVLTGFYDPNLLLELIDAGVPLTCILRIKRPGEELQLVDMEDSDSESEHKRNWFSSPVKKDDLVKFWRELEKYLKDSTRSEDFCKLIILTFCPPEIETLEKGQNFLKDIYDRISFIIYDLYELYRQHVEYLRTMKLQEVYEERPQRQDMSIYESVIADISLESVTPRIVLEALLAQVETNLNPSSDYEKNSLENSGSGIKISREPSNSGQLLYNQIRPHHGSLFFDESQTDATLIPLSFMERLVTLNFKHELITARDSNYDLSYHISDPKLVLYQDNHHLHVEQEILFDTNSIFQKIAALWHQNPFNKNLQQRYAYHINIIANCLEKKVDNITLRHYLNILAFQNIFKSEEFVDTDKKGGQSKPRSALSLPLTNQTLHLHWRSGSVDFEKDLTYYFECPILCALADSREILKPGYLEGNSLKRDLLSEFEDVELLSAPVFQKILQKCFEEYGYSQVQYFEPTDTILIIFSPVYVSEVSERVESGHLPTPICLREFCSDVINQSKMSAQKEIQENDLKGEEMSKSEERSQSEKDFMILRDENFMLPTSLKAAILGKVHQQPMDERKPKIREDKIVSERGGNKEKKLPKKEEVSKGKKEKGIQEKVTKERILDTPVDTSFLPTREKLLAKCAEEGEAFESIGYDLGERKFQVSSVKEKFSSIDGTVVDVDLETGLESGKLLRVGITNFGSRLQLHSVIDEDCLYSMFPLHFTTPEGLIMAFTKLRDNNRKL